MDLASDGINRKLFLLLLPSSLRRLVWRLMDLMLLMMDLVGSVCKMQKRTFFFFVELSWTYPFFIIADALQLFLHVKRGALFNHEAAKYKHIKFWMFCQSSSQRELSVQPSFKCLACATLSSHYTTGLWLEKKRGTASLTKSFYSYFEIISSWQSSF